MNAKEYVERGQRYWNEKNYDGAIADLTAAIQLEPNNSFIYCQRGISYLDNKEIDLAIADFNEAIRLEPDKTSEFYFERSLAYYFKGENTLAISDLETAVKIEPQKEDFYRKAFSDIKKQNIPSVEKTSVQKDFKIFLILMIVGIPIGAIIGSAICYNFIGTVFPGILIGAFYGIGLALFLVNLFEELVKALSVLKDGILDDLSEKGFIKGIVFIPLRLLFSVCIFMIWPGIKLVYKFLIIPFIAIYKLINGDYFA